MKKKNVLEGILGKIDKKTCHVSQILAIKGVELGEGLNPLKKEKLGLKSYKWKLQKVVKMISADIKTDAKQELERLVARCIS